MTVKKIKIILAGLSLRGLSKFGKKDELVAWAFSA